MFESLTKYKRIYVTGPQRSGTRICTKMIALDTEYRYIDEKEINIDDISKIPDINGIVVHCPALLHKCVQLADEDSLIVVMIRDVDDIIASQKRIGWGCEELELENYHEKGRVSEVKFRYWNIEKLLIPNYLEVEYESLKGHEMWVDKPDRKNFAFNQTS